MVASISIRVFTGASAATMSDAVSGIDFESADNAVNSLANRKLYPITVGNNSFEKWLKARVDVAPDNYVQNFLVWSDGGVMANTALYYGIETSGATPTASKSSKAIHDFSSVTAAAKGTWDAAQLVNVADLSKFLVFQLCTSTAAPPGNWTQETINYSYDEA